jgi:hypothetical protein
LDYFDIYKKKYIVSPQAKSSFGQEFNIYSRETPSVDDAC